MTPPEAMLIHHLRRILEAWDEDKSVRELGDYGERTFRELALAIPTIRRAVEDNR